MTMVHPVVVCWSRVSLLVFACLARTVSSGADTCYSTRTGYSDCWNGCCGPEDDQDCCSSTELILGLALGGGAVLLVVLLVVFCWACKDCRPKPHCCGGARPRHRGGGRGGHHRARHSRRVVVHPVGPPDYTIATQLRAPSVQPGVHNRNLPQTPPPPYVEIEPPSLAATRGAVPPPPPVAPSRSPRVGNNPTHLAFQSHTALAVSGPAMLGANRIQAEGAAAYSSSSSSTASEASSSTTAGSSGVGLSARSSDSVIVAAPSGAATDAAAAPPMWLNQPQHGRAARQIYWGSRGPDAGVVQNRRQDVPNVFVVQPAAAGPAAEAATATALSSSSSSSLRRPPLPTSSTLSRSGDYSTGRGSPTTTTTTTTTTSHHGLSAPDVPLRPAEPSSSFSGAGGGGAGAARFSGEASRPGARDPRIASNRGSAREGGSQTQATHVASSGGGQSRGAGGTSQGLRPETSSESVEDVDHLYLV